MVAWELGCKNKVGFSIMGLFNRTGKSVCKNQHLENSFAGQHFLVFDRAWKTHFPNEAKKLDIIIFVCRKYFNKNDFPRRECLQCAAHDAQKSWRFICLTAWWAWQNKRLQAVRTIKLNFQERKQHDVKLALIPYSF